MKNHIIDNSLKNLGKTVLWQYDRAVRLLSVLKHMQVMYHCAVEQFWDFWTTKVLAIDTCGPLGCSIWGIFLGVPRPTVKNEDGSERLIVTSVYRRLLKGAFYLMKSSCSFDSILGYLEIVFGIGGYENLSKWSVNVSEYGWYTNVEELNDEYIPGEAYYEGEVVWHRQDADDLIGENWKFTRDVTADENTSWEAIADARVRTNEETTRSAKNDTLLLKLYDPEGICRKIGGAPNNSLSISLSYEFGETTITAVATRRRKCGITLVDNGDMTMTYGKSVFYDEMHKDQKALFEQKIKEFCPYPLGIGDNSPVEEWVFGFAPFDAAEWWGRYATGRGYGVGAKFVHNYGRGDRLFIVKKQIKSSDNTSFDAVRSSLTETTDDVKDIGQDNVKYQSGVAYSKGAIFGYVDEKGHGFNYKCTDNISQSENKSFEAVSGKLVKTSEGDPFTSTFSNERPPWTQLWQPYRILSNYIRSTGGNGFKLIYWPPNFAMLDDYGGFALDSNLFLVEKDGLEVAAMLDFQNPTIFVDSRHLDSTYIEDLKKHNNVVECNSLDELLQFYDFIDSNYTIKQTFLKSQAETFNPKVIYGDGATILIDGEKWTLIRISPNTGFAYSPNSEANFKEHSGRTPKTTLISSATQKRIGQIK